MNKMIKPAFIFVIEGLFIPAFTLFQVIEQLQSKQDRAL